MGDDREVFGVEDFDGDVVRVMEWGHAPAVGTGGNTIGCLQFSDEEGEDGPTVHLTATAAQQLGEKLVAWAKSRGA